MAESKVPVSVASHLVGGILGKYMPLRGCPFTKAYTDRICRKTNQYGLTSDTVIKFNVVLPVRPFYISRWQVNIRFVAQADWCISERDNFQRIRR